MVMKLWLKLRHAMTGARQESMTREQQFDASIASIHLIQNGRRDDVFEAGIRFVSCDLQTVIAGSWSRVWCGLIS